MARAKLAQRPKTKLIKKVSFTAPEEGAVKKPKKKKVKPQSKPSTDGSGAGNIKPPSKKTKKAEPKMIPAWDIKTPYNVLVPFYATQICAKDGRNTLFADGHETEIKISTPFTKEEWLEKYATRHKRVWYYTGPLMK